MRFASRTVSRWRTTQSPEAELAAISTFEDRTKGLGGHGESEIEFEHDVVIVDSENTVSRSQRNPFAVLPILLGVLFLLANLLIFARVPTVVTVKNVNGTISLLLILVSVVISLPLIIFGFAARRSDGRTVNAVLGC